MEGKERVENRVLPLDEPPIQLHDKDDEISPEEAQMVSKTTFVEQEIHHGLDGVAVHVFVLCFWTA